MAENKVIRPKKKVTFESRLKIENALRRTKFGREQEAKEGNKVNLSSAQVGSIKKDLEDRTGIRRLKKRFKSKYGIILTAKDVVALKRALKSAKSTLSSVVKKILATKKLGGKVNESRQTSHGRSET